MKERFSNTCSRSPYPVMTRAANPNGLKLALFADMNAQMARLGISAQVLGFVRVIKPFGDCLNQCVTYQRIQCFSQNGCGPALPPNAEIIRTVRECGKANGLGTDGMRRLCQCAAEAGARQLAGICNKIVVS